MNNNVIETFSAIQQLSAPLQKVLTESNFVTPTDIQQKVIPFLLSVDHAHVHGQAQTGTGKTLAFGLPLLQRIDPSIKKTQGLVVAPTRELALQIFDALKPFANALNISTAAIYGGVSFDEQFSALARGTQIIIGTPGRINDHINRKTLSLQNLKTLVLDEADIMLDMGFREEVDIILKASPAGKEIWLFSATVKSGISDLVKSHMPDTHTFRVSKKQIATETVKQYYCIAPSRERVDILSRFIESAPSFYGFIFCQTKILTSEIAEKLAQKGYRVGALHGDLSQAQRNYIIKKFKAHDLSIVVATDVAARGIDIADLTHVVNFSLPEDLESYVHRIGRTGRAGKEGSSITFITKGELYLIKTLEKRFNLHIEPQAVPNIKDVALQRLNALYAQLSTLLDLPLSHHFTHNHEAEDMIKQNLINHASSYDKEMLQQIFVAYLFQTHFKELLKQKDTAQIEEPTTHEIVLSIGTDDSVTSQEIIQTITKNSVLVPDDIKRIRVIRRKTFVHVPADKSTLLIHALKPIWLKNRPLRPVISDSSPDDGAERGRSRRPFRRSDDRGGERRSGGGKYRRPPRSRY